MCELSCSQLQIQLIHYFSNYFLILLFCWHANKPEEFMLGDTFSLADFKAFLGLPLFGDLELPPLDDLILMMSLLETFNDFLFSKLCGLYSLGLHVNDLFFFSIMIFRIKMIFVNFKIRSYTQI